MEKLIIIGSGGCAKEVICIIENINKIEPKFNILGFISNDENKNSILGYPNLGTDDSLIDYSNEGICVVVAIGFPLIRKKIYEESLKKFSFEYPNIISPTASCGNCGELGIGNIICDRANFTIDYELGNFNLINVASTIAHDVSISDFVTINPGSNISGCVDIGECVDIGAGTQIIQNVKVGKYSVIGAGSVVINEVEDNSLYVGVPAKIKKRMRDQ